MSSKLALRVGLFGGGIVGGGVCELVQKYMIGKFPSLDVNIQIVKVCVRDLSKPRDFRVQEGTTFVTDYNDILDDPNINCVIELMGGVTSARDVVLRAINADKHVVTANKALIANFLPEIQTHLAAHPSVQFNYEAAVCGGIPIIHTLQTAYLGDTITKVMGIMNGTTNFMLCEMEDDGAQYEAALKHAQDLGFAEADPTADVEGHDVQAKIALLAKLSFGQTIDVAGVPTQGISGITAVDFEYAKILRSTIKLVGVASRNADDTITVFVSPMIVPLTSPLASAKGPGNMVVIHSENLTVSTYAGPGAGRFPTANSVVSDLVRICLGQSCAPFPVASQEFVNNDYLARFYVRIKCKDGLGIVRSVGQAAELAQVSIHSILQNPILNPADMDFVVVTELAKLSEVKAFADLIAGMPFALRPPLVMPML